MVQREEGTFFQVYVLILGHGGQSFPSASSQLPSTKKYYIKVAYFGVTYSIILQNLRLEVKTPKDL